MQPNNAAPALAVPVPAQLPQLFIPKLDMNNFAGYRARYAQGIDLLRNPLPGGERDFDRPPEDVAGSHKNLPANGNTRIRSQLKGLEVTKEGRRSTDSKKS